jgi:hypothetical protein
MHGRLFNEFLTSSNTLQVFEDDKLVFTSNKDRLLPLLEYIEDFAPYHREVVVFDKVMGRAAALLCVKAHSREVYSPLGSRHAIEALDKYGIESHLTQIVPHIQQADQKDMCPMERLSLGKGPEEFYKAIRNIVKKAQAEDYSGN